MRAKEHPQYISGLTDWTEGSESEQSELCRNMSGDFKLIAPVYSCVAHRFNRHVYTANGDSAPREVCTTRDHMYLNLHLSKTEHEYY